MDMDAFDQTDQGAQQAPEGSVEPSVEDSGVVDAPLMAPEAETSGEDQTADFRPDCGTVPDCDLEQAAGIEPEEKSPTALEPEVEGALLAGDNAVEETLLPEQPVTNVPGM